MKAKLWIDFNMKGEMFDKWCWYQQDLGMSNNIEWSCSWSVPYLLGNYMNYNHTYFGNLWHNSYIKILDLSFILWIDIYIKMNLILDLSHHGVCKPYDKYQEITWIFSLQVRYFNHMHFKTKCYLIYAICSQNRRNYKPMNRRQDSKWM